MCITLGLDGLREYVSMLSDIATGAAALTAAVVAVVGLQTWKKQLTGKSEYDVARRLLRSVYQVRQAIRFVRNPFISAGETSQALRESDVEIEPKDWEFHEVSQQAVYASRWQRVQDALSALDVEAFEAEVLWGSDVTETLGPLRRCISQLGVHIQLHLTGQMRPHRGRVDPETAQRIRQVIHETSDKSGQEGFTAELAQAVENVEKYIRPRLKP